MQHLDGCIDISVYTHQSLNISFIEVCVLLQCGIADPVIALIGNGASGKVQTRIQIRSRSQPEDLMAGALRRDYLDLMLSCLVVLREFCRDLLHRPALDGTYGSVQGQDPCPVAKEISFHRQGLSIHLCPSGYGNGFSVQCSVQTEYTAGQTFVGKSLHRKYASRHSCCQLLRGIIRIDCGKHCHTTNYHGGSHGCSVPGFIVLRSIVQTDLPEIQIFIWFSFFFRIDLKFQLNILFQIYKLLIRIYNSDLIQTGLNAFLDMMDP